MSRILFLSLALGAVFLAAVATSCSTEEELAETSDVASVPTFLWNCSVQCVLDDSVESNTWCVGADPLQAARGFLCKNKGGGGPGLCRNTGTPCEQGPPSPAW